MLSHIARPDYAESGVAQSERDAKRAGIMQQLSEDEIRGMRKACRVSEVIDDSMSTESVLICPVGS